MISIIGHWRVQAARLSGFLFFIAFFLIGFVGILTNLPCSKGLYS